MIKRRDFIQKTMMFGVGLSLTPSILSMSSKQIRKITILHTNDTHSQIDPFPESNKRYGNRGGVVRRASLIEQIRQKEDHVLLLDAGDVFQGTPYFNQFQGELEMKLMQQMKYDAMTMGNHDFDIGLSGFHRAYSNHASFPVVCSNYDFSDTLLYKTTIPHLLIRKGDLKIGIFGLGVELDGLVGKKNFEETRYIDPIKVANEKANFLRNDEKCDLVICLSHLGYSYKTDKISDVVLSKSTKNIDLIIGGHTHTFLDEPTIHENSVGNKVIVNQVGFGGINLGRIDFYFADSIPTSKAQVLRVG